MPITTVTCFSSNTIDLPRTRSRHSHRALSTSDNNWDVKRRQLGQYLKQTDKKFDPKVFHGVSKLSLATAGKTWFEYALSHKNQTAAKFLLNNGYAIDMFGSSNDAINLAVQFHDDAVVALLVKRFGANRNSTFKAGNNENPAEFLTSQNHLRLALASGDSYAAKLLINSGCSVQHSSYLADAARLGDLAEVKLLIHVGASPDLLTGCGFNDEDVTADFHYGIVDSLHLSALTAAIGTPILRKAAPVAFSPVIYGKPNESSFVAMMNAARGLKVTHDSREIARRLLADGCFAGERNASFPYTPLFFAVLYDDSDLVNELVKNGATIDPEIPSDKFASQTWIKAHSGTPLPTDIL